MGKISELVVKIAQGELGKQEIPKGSNWGKDVQKYLENVGINFPASWCMAFVHWCFDEAYKQACAVNPLFKSGGVLSTWVHTDIRYRVLHPQSGDIFIMDFGKGLGHTGIIVSVEGTTLHTIEGNTNDTGSREGYEVCNKTRQISKIKGFLRLDSTAV